MTHRITLDRNSLRFAAGHFATFGGECEPLHGHNYAVTVEIAGSLTGESWVVDFSEVKRIVGAICKELDHRFILQLDSDMLRIATSGDSYEIGFGDKRYVMPARDVAALHIDNSTAERLAQWFASRIAADLATQGATNVTSIQVGVEESPGQAGWYSLQVKDGEDA